MIRWLAPKCPLLPGEKTLVELWMRRLADEFGLNRLLKAEVLPPKIDALIPSYAGTEDDARGLLQALGRRMGLAPGKVILEVYPSTFEPNDFGLYERPEAEGEPAKIHVASYRLADPVALAASLAHALAHDILLGRGLLAEVAEEREFVADLLPLFFGLGLFMANVTVAGVASYPTYHGYADIERRGSFSSWQLGYALALFAHMRGESKPGWAHHLRPEALAAFRKGMRFLKSSNDCLFHPATIRTPLDVPSASEAARRLREGSPTIRVLTLGQIQDHHLGGAEVLAEVERLLKHRSITFPYFAALTLSSMGTAAATTVPTLLRQFPNVDLETKVCFLHAIGNSQGDPDEAIPALANLLEDDRIELVFAAATALGKFGRLAGPATRPLVLALEKATLHCHYELMDAIVEALHAVTDDPIAAAEDYLAERNEELRHLAVEALRKAREAEPAPAQAIDAPETKPGL
ncbi:HEAT repeat domain-containing protein [Singulisphaera sp. PoT]|uniref:HEAT repeat domain-containing protein n=1 Tax=Singulisphaera sp. PoT TaxID=3411797 RepID=UPI003BF4D39B